MLYGTTFRNYGEAVTLFRISPDGALQTLQTFGAGLYVRDLIQADDGNFYLTTYDAVLRMTPDGTLTTLHTFSGGVDGRGAVGLVQASDRHLYGTTATGGNTRTYYGYGAGTIFRLTLAGDFTVMHRFDEATEGAVANVKLVQGTDGSLYGTTSCSDIPGAGGGGFFRLMLSGAFTVLARNGLGCPSEISEPVIPLTAGLHGKIYGVMSGAVFELNSDGSRATLCDYATCHARDSLTLAADGSLYGISATYDPDPGRIFRLLPIAMRPAHVSGSTRRGLGVRLTWAKSDNAISYQIKRGSAPGREVVLAWGVRDTTFTDTTGITGQRYYYIVTAINEVGESLGTYEVAITAGRATRADFDGDARADLTVFRPAGGTWYSRLSGDSLSYDARTSHQWGLPGDVPLSGDYDGDGKMDLVVFRPSAAIWYLKFSSSGFSDTTWTTYRWGLPGDVPLAADFDGDGKTDLVVFRPSTATWYIKFSSSGFSDANWVSYQWGLAGDVPLVGDFDADGKADLVVFRPASSTWYVRFSSDGYSLSSWTSFQWGLVGDVPLAADFDGDGRTDLTVFRPATSTWYVRFSSTNFSESASQTYRWGLSGDLPIAMDVDGDGRTDLTVFRPTTGEWFVRFSLAEFNLNSVISYQWGLPGDIPLPLGLSHEAPSLAAVDTVTTRINTPISVDLRLGEAAAAGVVILAVRSSNTAIVPNENLVLNGSGATRTLRITPAGNQRGATTITVTAVSGIGATSVQFAVVVGARPGDLNGDGRSDLLWRHSSGATAVWFMSGTATLGGASLGTIDPAWQIVGTGDYNGDGRADLLWRHSSGAVVIWFMDGGSVLSAATVSTVDPAWQIVGTADYNGDGLADILWRHTSGYLTVWLMDGSSIIGGGFIGNADPSWQIAGSADFNGDGRADILWTRNGGGNPILWLMNGGRLLSASSIIMNYGYNVWWIIGIGDFDGDGRADTLTRSGSGEIAVWRGGAEYRDSIGYADWSWQVVGTGDYNVDGKSDILWRDTSGALTMWLMDGTRILSAVRISTVDPAWQIVQTR